MCLKLKSLAIELITDLSRNMNLIIVRSSNESYIQIAILSLIVFKSRAYQLSAISSAESEQMKQIKDYRSSRFGHRYYDGLGFSTLGNAYSVLIGITK